MSTAPATNLAWRSIDEQQKFESHVTVDKPTRCWFWTGSNDRHGYGRFSFDGTTILAHRRAYEVFNGPIADGLEIDHLCRIPKCVNPVHLEAVTHQENIKRGKRFWQKCPHGDQFRYSANRTCTVCANERRRAVYALKRSTANGI